MELLYLEGSSLSIAMITAKTTLRYNTQKTILRYNKYNTQKSLILHYIYI